MFRRVLTIGLISSALFVPSASAQQMQIQNVQAQRVEVARPADLEIEAPVNATILRAQTTEAIFQQRNVQRRLDLETVRAQPVIPLTQGEADMRPVLNNPAAPINVAQRLRARPALATVKADDLEVTEIEEGLVVRQVLAYQLAPGTCTDTAKRRQVAQEGVQCFTRRAPGERAAQFAQPSNQARFIANRADRQRAIAEANAAAQEQQAEIDGDIAQLRQYLTDPEARGQIGASEANRLSAMTDQQLQEEMLGRADVAIEEVMFIPNLEAQDLRIQARPTFGQAVRPPRQGFELADVSVKREAADARIVAAGGGPQASSLPAPHRRGPTDLRTVPTRPQGMTDFQAGPMLDIEQDIAIDREIYLTGFTLGRQHEWRRRVSITVAWCLLGCKRTYYVEPYAGFSYGFGLRFPLRMDGTYRYRHQNGQERAYFVPDFRPINGNTNQYARTGLPSNKRFNGQELVAEAQAYAGFLYKLTGNRKGDIGVNVGVDLTDRLPSPFANGQFTPPAPGSTTPPVIRTIEQIDFLAGRASFSIVGAKVHPAVKMELFSNGIRFDLRDHVNGSTTAMLESGKAYPLGVNNNHFSRFSVRNPIYNLGFQMTPGIVGRAYVDIAVWSRTWNWPIWFPQLKVQLPPGGANFACHAGTVCGHEYKLRADHWRPKPRPPRANPTRQPTRTTPARAPTRTNPPRDTGEQEAAPQRMTTPQRATTAVIARPVTGTRDREAEDEEHEAAPLR